MTKKQSVQNFLGAYFHQDWCDESDSWLGAVRMFCVESRSLDDNIVLSRDLVALASECHDDESLEEILFHDYGCFYRPSAEGLSAREWLNQVSEIVRSKDFYS